MRVHSKGGSLKELSQDFLEDYTKPSMKGRDESLVISL